MIRSSCDLVQLLEGGGLDCARFAFSLDVEELFYSIPHQGLFSAVRETMERLPNTQAARRRQSAKINEVDDLLASNEFDLARLRSILQRLEKSTDELVKANEALHAEMTDDEVLADFDSVLEHEDRAAGCVGLLRHHIQELTLRSSVLSRPNVASWIAHLPASLHKRFSNWSVVRRPHHRKGPLSPVVTCDERRVSKRTTYTFGPRQRW
ncbi:hypothetical protein HPB52_003101 [Rhipicephalus sanguineus]|uniref:Uncharacterized protein n=1 Tax=Rhipicephalus sanguineus TaxID=34632 RepID=A0A9D4T6W2_RHISA|nr:hypothetical protein HPB52_003101 [Rhipicephalus sanguineus]